MWWNVPFSSNGQPVQATYVWEHELPALSQTGTGYSSVAHKKAWAWRLLQSVRQGILQSMCAQGQYDDGWMGERVSSVSDPAYFGIKMFENDKEMMGTEGVDKMWGGKAERTPLGTRNAWNDYQNNGRRKIWTLFRTLKNVFSLSYFEPEMFENAKVLPFRHPVYPASRGSARPLLQGEETLLAGYMRCYHRFYNNT